MRELRIEVENPFAPDAVAELSVDGAPIGRMRVYQPTRAELDAGARAMAASIDAQILADILASKP